MFATANCPAGSARKRACSRRVHRRHSRGRDDDARSRGFGLLGCGLWSLSGCVGDSDLDGCRRYADRRSANGAPAPLGPRLAFGGAVGPGFLRGKGVQPDPVLPAISKNIPVSILNSRQPEKPGTLITAEPQGASGQLTAIACKRDVTVIDITSTRMFMAHGFLRRVFEVFERFKTAVDVVTTSEVSVSVTIDDARWIDGLVDGLRGFADVECERDMAIICAVGEDVHEDPTAFGRAISALGSIPLRMVSQAASRRNITFVLRDADAPQAMMQLHEAFFERVKN